MINISVSPKQETIHNTQEHLTWFNCALHAQFTSTGKATGKALLMNQEDKYRTSQDETTSIKITLSHSLISL